MRSDRAQCGAPSGSGHQRALAADTVSEGRTTDESAATAASTRMATARERRRWSTVADKPMRLARGRACSGSLLSAQLAGGRLLSGQGNTRADAPYSSQGVRLVCEVAAILSIAAGVIHISAAGDHTDLPVMFAGFLLVAALQIALGALLLRRQPSRLIVAAAVAMMLSSIGLWLLSRTAGLPYLPDGHVEPIGFKDGVTKLFEIASIPLLLVLLSTELARVSLPSRRLGSQTRASVGIACVALMAPALVLGGGTQHSHEQAVALGLHTEHDGSSTTRHAGSPSTHDDASHDGAQHAKRSHGAGDDHTHAASDHTGLHLASAPLGGTHEHGAAGAPGDAPIHHSEQHGDRRDHGGHGNRPGDKHHGGDHGHGGGEHEPPEAEPAISVTYEPEPSVCVGGVLCVP